MTSLRTKLITIVALTIFLSSCGMLEIASNTKYQEIMDGYVGKDVSSLIKDFRYPDNIMPAPNGNKLYVYESSNTSTSPVTCNKDLSGNTNCSGGNTSTNWCKTYFEVDLNNVVKNYSYKGNNCRRCKSDAMLCM
jgi:hypothetical protein